MIMKNICIALLVAGLSQTIMAAMDTPSAVTVIESKDLADNGTKSLEWYLSLEGGLVAPRDADVNYTGGGSATLSYSPGYQIGAAVGLNGCANCPLRAEFGLSYSSYDWDKWVEGGISYNESMNSTSLLNFMFNGYWDIDNSSIVTPFIMGGIGCTRVMIDHQNNDYNDTVFAGQLGGGFNVAIAEKISIGFQYRYMMTADAEFTDAVNTTTLENDQHQFLLGITAGF
jgi:opacity protein-like surface antigen